MRYVILRDDDTNALTPVDCLEKLYRPFLERGLPVNLATIPEVAVDTRIPDGNLEGYLLGGATHNSLSERGTVPISSNRELVRYLLNNSGFNVIQHGLHHDYLEFDRLPAKEAAEKFEHGSRLLLEAGFPKPQTFVAPYDKLSRSSYQEAASRFRVISTGWYELKRVPIDWWPGYAWKKMSGAPHWHVGSTLLLSHPGCLLSCFRTYETMLEGILRHINEQKVTVLVTHWWEYFRKGQADEEFIDFLHTTARYLANHKEIKVISFSELVSARIPLN